MASVAELFVCPGCGEALGAGAGGVHCAACGRRFVEVAGATCLFAEPARFVQGWGRALAQLVRQAEQNQAAIREQRRGAMGSVERRLARLQEGLRANVATIRELLLAAGIPLEESVGPRAGDVMEVYVQSLRDWAWDTEENALALERMPKVEGRVLVLGAGACRLAWDLHRRDAPDHTVVLDVHPLPFAIAQRAMAGPPLTLWEFPPTPSAEMCVEREVTIHGAAAPWSFVLADGLSLPVQPGAFDTVVTPWFIDQVPTNVAELLPVIQRALRPGGRWLNLGPLVYRQTIDIACRYTIDELVELAAQHGLTMAAPPTRRTERYLCSPASGQGRLEEVFAFAAERDAAPAMAVPPAWWLHPQAPIPRWPELATFRAPNPLVAAVVERIDGHTSASDIAASLVQQLGIPAEGASQGVHATVRELARQVGRAPTPAATS
ncbi:MAG: methyltransferase domain-containing protein [Myxococcales bacterium]|nr:methyltransferase domain-containing protein [Myxococcales bacterium]